MLAFLSVAFFLAALPLLSGAQSSLLVGTWSSGSGAVLTGPVSGDFFSSCLMSGEQKEREERELIMIRGLGRFRQGGGLRGVVHGRGS
jgi:hypothetical protein